jgi:hypothetical protein
VRDILPYSKEGNQIMKKLMLCSIFAILFCLLASASWAASTDSHQVTVIVSAISEIEVSGGNVTLTINSATAGSEPDDAVDNTTCDLLWTTNESSKKITVSTDLTTPNFTLKVAAQNVSGGRAASEVTLSTTAADFVTGIATTTGSCDLQYTASATVAHGTGTDTHATVLYTLTAS